MSYFEPVRAQEKRFVWAMLLLMLAFGLATILLFSSIHSAGAAAKDEPVEATGQYVIIAYIASVDGDHLKVLGAAAGVETKKVWFFDTQEECEKFVKTSRQIDKSYKEINPVLAKWYPPAHLEYKCQEKPRVF